MSYMNQTCIKLFDKKLVRVRDHCHMTGNYRGSTYNIILNFDWQTRYLSFFIILKDMKVIL